MSSHIVDRIEAIVFRVADTHNRMDEDTYLLCELGGDSNCFDMSGRRARDWSAVVIGPEWQVIGRCCQLAGDCSGGMLKLRGRTVKPEAYIRAYRKAIANAAEGLVGAGQRGLIVSGRIRMAVGATTNGEKCHFENLCKYKQPSIEKNYGQENYTWHLKLSDSADMKFWAENARNPAWNMAEVYGPTR